MITYEQAIKEDEFHLNGCSRTIGPRGGITINQTRFRRNGRTQVRKTRPGQFRIPIKWGLKGYAYIVDTDAHRFHTTSDCPLLTLVEG